MMWIFSSLSFAGYTPGRVKIYDLGGFAYGYDVDSVAVVDTWDGSGSRCTFITPVDRAIIYSMNYHISPGDTVIAYFDGTYLIENFGRNIFSIYLNYIGIRALKFPPTVGDTWMAIDTCSAPLMQWYSYDDFDGDGNYDSIYIYPSTMRTVYINGDTIITYSDSIYRRVRFPKNDTIMIDTSITPPDTLILLHIDYLMSDYVKFVYVAGTGYIWYSIDSMGYTTYEYIYHTRTSSIDTVVYPRDVTYNIYSRSLRTTSVYETSHYRNHILVHGRKVKLKLKGTYTIKVYLPSGKLLTSQRATGSITLNLPMKGVYFIKVGKKVYKVMVK